MCVRMQSNLGTKSWDDAEWESYGLCLRYIRTNPDYLYQIPTHYKTTELLLEFIRCHPRHTDKISLTRDTHLTYAVILELMKTDPVGTTKRVTYGWQRVSQQIESILAPFKTLELCLHAIENDYTRLTEKYLNDGRHSLFTKFIPQSLIKPIKQVLIVRRLFPLLQLELSQNLMVVLCDELENQMFDTVGRTISSDNQTVCCWASGTNLTLIGGRDNMRHDIIINDNMQHTIIDTGIQQLYDKTLSYPALQKLSLYETDCMIRVMKSL